MAGGHPRFDQDDGCAETENGEDGGVEANAQAILEQDHVTRFDAVCDERALYCTGEGEKLGECGGLARGGTGQPDGRAVGALRDMVKGELDAVQGGPLRIVRQMSVHHIEVEGLVKEGLVAMEAALRQVVQGTDPFGPVAGDSSWDEHIPVGKAGGGARVFEEEA